MSENKTLDGGVSYNKYIWHSSNDSCEECTALDGNEYEYEGDIPDPPHPNCKCYVETIENEEDENKEPCDCLDDLEDDVDELIGDSESLKDEIESAIDEFMDFLSEKYIEPVKDTISDCIDNLEQIFGTVSDFIENYNDMKEANTIGADKYFHSKANCDGSQRGELGAEVAKGISDLREYADSFKNVYIKGMTEAESAKDSAEDQEANEYGREQGRQNPGDYCGDMVDIFRPNGLPPQY